MAGVIGGDLVGMSTTLEAIAARQAGLEVLGISLVTNLAAGISDAAARPRRGARGRPGRRRALRPRCWPRSCRHRSDEPPARAPATAPADAWSSAPTRVARRRPGPGHPRRAGRRAAPGRRRATRGRRGRPRRPVQRAAGVRHGRAARRARRRPEPDEPRGGHPRGGRPRGVPARARRRHAERRHRVRRAAQLRRVRPRHRRGGDRRRRHARSCCPARCRPRCWRSRSAHLGADAGVMVTASHNPPQDNGYKVYLGDGSQIVPPADAEIAARHRRRRPRRRRRRAPPTAGTALGDGRASSDYLDAAARGRRPGRPARPRRRATPRCTGSADDRGRRRLRARRASPRPHVVAAAGRAGPGVPDGRLPQPRGAGRDRPGAGAGRASVGADLVLANDPDADRCAVAVPDPPRRARRLADAARRRGRRPARRRTCCARGGRRGRASFANSIVSSRLLAAHAPRPRRARTRRR